MPFTVTPSPKGFPPLDTSAVETTMARKDVDARHPEWTARQDLWFNVGVLYEGGHLIKQHAERFLPKRPREDSSVYAHRLAHFTYENHMGTGLGWHEAEMFKRPPTITIKVADADGQPTEATLSPEQEDFYSRVQKDCDRHGTALVDQCRKVFNDLLLYQHSWILTDMPVQPEAGINSLADQKAKRLLDPFTQVVSPMQVINWDCDDYGNLIWAVIYTKATTRAFGKAPVTVERWYLLDQQTFRVYEAEDRGDAQSAVDRDKQPVNLVRIGYHALAAKGRVPLSRISVQPGWWMGNRTYLTALEHVDVSNSLKWSLKMAALAMPVIITNDDITQLHQSEGGFFKMSAEQGANYKFAEPSGTCWEHLANKAAASKEEIFRSLYLISQARTNKATASAQSGVSKQQDMKPSHDVLNGIGDVLRCAIQGTLDNIAAARALIPGFESDANLVFDVRGFTFEDSVTVDEVDTISGVHALKVPSKTFEKEVDKLVVQAVLPDMNPEMKTAIFREIDAAPTRGELEQQQQEAEADRLSASLNAAVNQGKGAR
ncbi:hypothetical protein [uncultured Paludibaculum sp.]|uniref:hypothetical protein n=1 Tax=uncultured Paludibaculum sp. TaxID=1765020 RepID=UPI002AAAC49B|nr:hypothetical protein [uncultured Paludibaculum sp.]